jgi:hypothetical protein
MLLRVLRAKNRAGMGKSRTLFLRVLRTKIGAKTVVGCALFLRVPRARNRGGDGNRSGDPARPE